MRPEVVARTLVRIFLVVLAWSALWSVASVDGRVVYMEGWEQHGFRGTFGHKNELGMFAVYGLCVVLPFAEGRRRLAAIVLCVVVVFTTRSATGAAGLLAVVFGWTFVKAFQRQRTSRERQFLVAVGLTAVVAAVLIVLGLLPALLDIYDKDTTFSGRTTIWAAASEAISEEWIRGYGFGAVWADERAPLTFAMRSTIGFDAAHAHNSAMEILLEAGVIGLALGVAVYIQILRLAARALRRATSAPYGQWAALTMAAMVVMGIAEPLLRGVHLGLAACLWTVLFRVLAGEAPLSVRRSGRSDAGSAASPSIG